MGATTEIKNIRENYKINHGLLAFRKQNPHRDILSSNLHDLTSVSLENTTEFQEFSKTFLKHNFLKQPFVLFLSYVYEMNQHNHNLNGNPVRRISYMKIN